MTTKAKQEKKMIFRYTDDEIELIGLPTHPELKMVAFIDDEDENIIWIVVDEIGDEDADSIISAKNYLWFDGVEVQSENGVSVEMSIRINKKVISYYFNVSANNHLVFLSKTIVDYMQLAEEDEIVL